MLRYMTKMGLSLTSEKFKAFIIMVFSEIKYKVIKKGQGLIYGHLKPQVVKTNLSWQDAHDYVHAQNVSSSWNYYFMPEALPTPKY